MILINKDEAMAVRESVPGAHVVRTMKQKSKRHRYYCEETKAVMSVINKIRGNVHDKTTSREGGYHKSKQKRR